MGEFFEGCLRHVKGPMLGEPWILHPSQQEDIDLIYEVDRLGERVWRDVIWGVARGYGKSPLCAGMGLAELTTRSGAPEVYTAAAARGQAEIMQGYGKRFVETGPLVDYVKPLGTALGSQLMRQPVGTGWMKTVSGDGDMSQGLFPAVALLDELHTWKTAKQLEVYTAFQSAMQKVPESLMATITTAGLTKVCLLGDLFDARLATCELEFDPKALRLVARDRENGLLMIWRGAVTEQVGKLVGCEPSDVSDPNVWRKCNPGPWIGTAELKRLAKTMPTNRFCQLILNMWPEGSSSVFDAETWDACELAEDERRRGDDAWLERIPEGAAVWLAVSIAPNRQSGAIVVSSPRSDDRIVVSAKIIEHVDQDTLKADLEDAVRDACAHWEHQALAADRWQFGASMDRLAGEGVSLWCGKGSKTPGFPQTDPYMVPASGALMELVSSERIAHDGDRDLRRHVLGAESKMADRGWRVARPKAIDDEHEAPVVEAALALAMAAYITGDEPVDTPIGKWA